jgi:hypothetical protein
VPGSVEQPLVHREKRLAVVAQEKLLLVSEAASAKNPSASRGPSALLPRTFDRWQSSATFFEEREFDDTNASG